MTGPVADVDRADGAPPTSPPPRERPGFAHASEAEFARILDFYQVGWQYEPHVFPILWSLDGDVLESFAPDFYLPELDLYVEMTTLRQKLVRKKNRKLRRLRELYPDIRIKLFYARDFRALMLKYGKVALADALTGAEGQLTPDGATTASPTAAPDQPAAEPASAAGHPPRPAVPSQRRTSSRGRRPVTATAKPAVERPVRPAGRTIDEGAAR